MTWFYGEPVWHELSPEKRLHAEPPHLLPELSLDRRRRSGDQRAQPRGGARTIIHDDPEVALYMAREVVEETMHIQAFLFVIRKVLGALRADARGAARHQRVAAHGVALRRASHGPRLAARRSELLLLHALRAEREPEDRRALHHQRAEHASASSARCSRTTRSTRRATCRCRAARGWSRAARMRTRSPRTSPGSAYAHFAANIYIGRHRRDSALPRETRMRTLELCGVPRARAERAYGEWRDRVNQPQDPPLVQAGRALLSPLQPRLHRRARGAAVAKRRMKRIIDAELRRRPPGRRHGRSSSTI